MHEKLKFNKTGQWELHKVQVSDDIRPGPWHQLHAPRGQYDHEDLKETNKVKVGDKDMYHHVFADRSGDVTRHTLSEHADPKKEAVSNVYGSTVEGDWRLSAAKVHDDHVGHGYTGKLLHEVIKHHGTVIGDSQESKAGHALMQSVGKDPRYEFYNPETVDLEGHLKQLESGKLSPDETKELKRKAQDRAKITLKRD